MNNINGSPSVPVAGGNALYAVEERQIGHTAASGVTVNSANDKPTPSLSLARDRIPSQLRELQRTSDGIETTNIIAIVYKKFPDETAKVKECIKTFLDPKNPLPPTSVSAVEMCLQIDPDVDLAEERVASFIDDLVSVGLFNKHEEQSTNLMVSAKKISQEQFAALINGLVKR